LPKVIQDLWILQASGVVVYNRVFDSKVNEQLFGGLMSALNAFATELSSGGLTNFELSKIRFTILKDQEFLFVANSAKKVKEKKVQDELKNVADRFFNKYPLEWFKNDWDGDIGYFDDFEEVIGDQLQDPIKKFWDGLVQ
jgi:hypothetical protein